MFIRFYRAGYKSAANPLIKSKHFFPNFLLLIKNYMCRIYKTINLVYEKKTSFTHISKEKAIYAPICGFAFVCALILYFLHYSNSIIAFFFFILYNYLNREIIKFAKKRITICFKNSCRTFFYISSNFILRRFYSGKY